MTELKKACSDDFYTYKQVGAGGMVVMSVGMPFWAEIEYDNDDPQLYLMHVTENYTHTIITDLLSIYPIFVLK